jgi:hypothetical protein
VVEAGNASRLAARLRAAGNVATARIYSRVGHSLIVAALAPVLQLLMPIWRDIDGFIAETLRARSQAVAVRRGEAVAGRAILVSAQAEAASLQDA